MAQTVAEIQAQVEAAKAVAMNRFGAATTTRTSRVPPPMPPAKRAR